jgi:HEAT repeat protein
MGRSVSIRIGAIAAGLLLAAGTLAVPPPQSPTQPGKADVAPESRPKPAARDADQWLLSLADGYAEAQRLRQPVFLRVGGPDCPWCRKLEAELRKPELKDELTRWSLVSLDADKAADEIKPFSVSGIPALRVLTPTGRLIASHDGYLAADELLAWLKKNYAAASAVPDAELVATGPPSAEAVGKIVGVLKDRDPSLREAAVRRLMPYPAVAAEPVAQTFAAGPLQARLAALDLLREWQAPVDGLDPWRPETLGAERLAAVKSWSTHPPAELPPKPLAASAPAAARLDLDRLATVSDAEAAATRERLARHGPALMPEVYTRLKNPPTDQARERLTALRYRLVANDALVLNWPGGLDRLASDDPRFRHAAIQELARRAGPADEALLLELFSSPDALVRELSLRILHATVGRNSTAALVKLLGDPEPNVRAAVLKQLADQPTPGMVSQLATYIAQETDQDLVVHAVRALRAVDSQESLDALKPLTKHAAWRVRAEAAQAVGESVTNYRRNLSEPAKAAVYATLIEILNDRDGFVVSRAIAALKKGDRREAVEPLAKLADSAEPLLAAQAVHALNTGNNTREQALPHLRRFCAHKEPAVRAAAIKELCLTVGASVNTELPAALKDSASQVRTAGADAVLQMLNSRRGGFGEEDATVPIPQPVPVPVPEPAMKAGGLLDGLLELFGGQPQPPQVQPPPAPPPSLQPAPVPPEPPADPDKAFEEIRHGKGRPKWMNDLPPLLEPMLTAADPEERLAGALALTALGREERGLPVVLEVSTKVRSLRGKAGDVLPWLPWAKREDTYNRLIALNPDPEPLEQIVQGLTTTRDKRTLSLLWKLAARDSLTNELVGLTVSKLQDAYFGNDLYTRVNGQRTLKPANLKQATEDAKPKAESGPENQRLIALTVLQTADAEAAKAAAEKIIEDAAAPERLRRDAFRVRLATLTQPERRAAARAALSHPAAEVRRVAVAYLALENDANLHWLPDRGLQLDSGANMVGIMQGPRAAADRPYVPERPKEITPDVLHKLLSDPSPQTVAAAGYLLALFGDPAGFDALVRYWREEAPKEADWARLVCRAVVALDDDAQVKILEEVYQDLPSIGLDAKEFYWSIRRLDGPQALRLRRVMRSEHGMESLR